MAGDEARAQSLGHAGDYELRFARLQRRDMGFPGQQSTQGFAGTFFSLAFRSGTGLGVSAPTPDRPIPPAPLSP